MCLGNKLYATMETGLIFVANRNFQHHGKTGLNPRLVPLVGTAFDWHLAIHSRRSRLARTFFLDSTVSIHETTITQPARYC